MANLELLDVATVFSIGDASEFDGLGFGFPGDWDNLGYGVLDFFRSAVISPISCDSNGHPSILATSLKPFNRNLPSCGTEDHIILCLYFHPLPFFRPLTDHHPTFGFFGLHQLL